MQVPHRRQRQGADHKTCPVSGAVGAGHENFGASFRDRDGPLPKQNTTLEPFGHGFRKSLVAAGKVLDRSRYFHQLDEIGLDIVKIQ